MTFRDDGRYLLTGMLGFVATFVGLQATKAPIHWETFLFAIFASIPTMLVALFPLYIVAFFDWFFERYGLVSPLSLLLGLLIAPFVMLPWWCGAFAYGAYAAAAFLFLPSGGGFSETCYGKYGGTGC